MTFARLGQNDLDGALSEEVAGTEIGVCGGIQGDEKAFPRFSCDHEHSYSASWHFMAPRGLRAGA